MIIKELEKEFYNKTLQNYLRRFSVDDLEDFKSLLIHTDMFGPRLCIYRFIENEIERKNTECKNPDYVSNVVNKAYRKLIDISDYDPSCGIVLKEVLNDNMAVAAHKLHRYVEDYGYGESFLFSTYLIENLEKENINSYLICSKENDEFKAFVMYEDNGELFVADPTSDIKYFTESLVSKEDRFKYYSSDSSIININGELTDNSRINLNEFTKKYKNAWLIGKMNNYSTQVLASALSTLEDKCILPPDKANFEAKILIKRK